MSLQSLTHGTICKIVLCIVVACVALQILYGTTIPTYSSHETLFYIPLSVVGGKQPPFSSHPQIDNKTGRNSYLATLLLANATVGPAVLEILVSHAGRNNTSSQTLPANKTVVADSSQNLTEKALCPLVPPNLKGPIPVRLTAPPEETIELLIKGVTPGGHYTPPECRPRSRVAIIIPYRDRVENLNAFLYHMHPLLQRQQLEYGIIVVEQEGTGVFNRAMLMNVGFVESQKLHEYDCFVFHDVDLLPEDDRNLYSCPEQPRHMSVAVSTLKYRLVECISSTQCGHDRSHDGFLCNPSSAFPVYPFRLRPKLDLPGSPPTFAIRPRHLSPIISVFVSGPVDEKGRGWVCGRLPYRDIFGGVSAMTLEQFKTVNGFSNKFWGWGGEDDDMANRVKSHGFHISRYPANIARYKMMHHRRQPVNPKRYEYLYTGNKRFNTDGLNSLNYVRVNLKLRKLYTWILVELTATR